MEKIIEIIQKRAKSEFDIDTNLIQEGVIDSIDFMNIISEIEEKFNVEIDFLEIDPQKITTINGLWEIINVE